MSDSPKPRVKRVGYRRARRHIEAVASRLDESLRDLPTAIEWHDLVSLWQSAERKVRYVDEWLTWAQGTEDNPDVRPHLLAAAAVLLDLSSHIEAMRRTKA